jgi:choice-of-anchor B domain-containing protein
MLVLCGALSAAALPVSPSHDPVRDQFTAFGRAVAVSGEYAFVGEPSAGGRGGGAAVAGIVHVYRRGPAGWKEVDQITAPGSASGDAFGIALAVDGATLLVARTPPVPPRAGRFVNGAVQLDPIVPDTSRGAVFAYQRGADGKWHEAGQVGQGVAGSQFGAALAFKGTTVLIGAPTDSGGGGVHVFRRSQDGAWTSAGSLPAQGLAPGDRFGASVAIDGDRAAVGAPGRRLKGAVFIFHRAADGAWSQETEQLAASTAPDNGQLGTAVAVSGDRVFAGAPAANFAAPVTPTPAQQAQINAMDSAARKAAAAAGQPAPQSVSRSFGPQIQAGMTVIFERGRSGSWHSVATLIPFNMASDRFGSALAVVGDELWIGAPGSDGMGRIYRARHDADGNWTSMTKLVFDSVDANAQFSAAFAVAGDVAVVGMPGDGGGAGTVAFLGRTPAGSWTLKGTSFPPQKEQYAAVSGKEVKCGTDGKASDFACSNTGLLSYMPISAVGGKRGINLSGSWGWTDPLTGKDYAIIGRTDAAAFVDVTDPVHPRYLGDLPRTKGANISSWREIKTYRNYALIVSDGSGDHHGIQFFDLTHLRNVTTPRHFTEDAHYDLGSIHDIVVNEQSGFAYAVGVNGGGEGCGGGLHMVDIHDPLHPTFAGCFADASTGRAKTGYTHDAQCVMYHGPDTRFTGHEICMASNETTVSIQDVTDKKNIKVLSHADYPTVGYTHQGWFTEDQKYFYLDDELDEMSHLGKSAEGTRTMVFDVSDLEQPVMKKEYIGPTKAIDHNQYVRGNRLYQSNYQAGLRILDISDPLNPREVGYLDTWTGPITASFSGSWNNYPFFKNRAIGVVSIGEGFFMVKDRTQEVVP